MKAELAILFWTDASMHGTSQQSRKDWINDSGLIDGVAAGLVVHEDKKQITLALDWFPKDDQFRQVASYPKSGIRQIIRKEIKSKQSVS